MGKIQFVKVIYGGRLLNLTSVISTLMVFSQTNTPYESIMYGMCRATFCLIYCLHLRIVSCSFQKLGFEVGGGKFIQNFRIRACTKYTM